MMQSTSYSTPSNTRLPGYAVEKSFIPMILSALCLAIVHGIARKFSPNLFSQFNSLETEFCVSCRASNLSSTIHGPSTLTAGASILASSSVKLLSVISLLFCLVLPD
jgi:hypothetical protein